jgi:hypothetical protein
VHSAEAERDRARHWCPFVDKVCNKQTRLAPYPMGVCSVQYGEEVIALSPRRLLQDQIVFRDIAEHHFGGLQDLIVFSEISIPKATSLGRFDFVMVKHKPLSSEIEDFVAIELQTGQTTNTGGLVQGLQDYLAGEEVGGKNYGFGLNLADIWKRAFTQVLTEGIVMERWGHKVYWVLQEPIYRDLVARYSLQGMGHDPGHSTVFIIYDMVRAGERYVLERTRVESATVDGLFEAFRTNLAVPPEAAFLEKLSRRVRRGLSGSAELGLRIG